MLDHELMAAGDAAPHNKREHALRHVLVILYCMLLTICASAQRNESAPIVANLGRGASDLMLWTMLPFEVPVPAGGLNVHIKIDDARILRTVSQNEVLLYAIAVPFDTSSTISTLPADVTHSSLSQLAEKAQSARHLDWAIGLKLDMKWSAPNLIFSIAERSAVVAVAPGKVPPPQVLVHTLNGMQPFVVQKYPLNNVKIQIHDRALDLNIVPVFRANGMSLIGIESVKNGRPSVESMTTNISSDETRLTIPITMLNRIYQIGYSDSPILLQAGQGQTIQLSNVKATGAPNKLTLSADVGPTIPGCNVHTTTIWTGADLTLSSISMDGSKTLACQPEVGKWQLIGGALSAIYAGGKTKLRPTSMTAIPTSVAGRPVGIILLVTSASTNGSSVVATAKVSFRTE